MLQLRDFLASSASLLLSQVLTAGVGFVFWLIASRTYSQSEVGFASAVTSGISLAGAVGAMGLGTMLIREIPRHHGREIAIIAASLAASALIGAVLGVVLVAITPLLSPEFAPIRGSVVVMALVTVGGSVTAASLVIDQALIGLLRSGLQLVRNVVAAVLRLALLIAFGAVAASALGGASTAATGQGGSDMIAAWVVSSVLSMGVLALVAARRGALRAAYPLDIEFLGRQWLPALEHHMLNLAIQIPGWAMPIVAVVALSAESNGGFFLAWQLVGIAAFVQVALTWILYAAASRDVGSLPRWGWLTLRLSLVTAAGSAAGLWLLGPAVLGLFGGGYATAGREALVALPLTVLGGAIKGHYITIHRVHGTIAAAARLVAVGGAIEILGGFIGASVAGLAGLGIGVVVAMGLEILPMLPVVFRAIVKPQLVHARG